MLQYPAVPTTGAMALTVCKSEQEAWDFLNTNQNSGAKDPKYLYRGQSNRFFRRWPPRPENGIVRHRLEMDSIVPTDYRGLEDLIANNTANADPFFTEDAARLRSILTWGAVVEHGQSLTNQDHHAIVQWLNDQALLPHRFDAVGSIGQHYGFMTGYTDASSSLAVAFWMATRNFAQGGYQFSGQSVIYRWKLKELRDTLDDVNAAANSRGGAAEARVVDIRNIPPQIGIRPGHQAGWSLILHEQVTVHLELLKKDVIEAVVFPRTGPCADNNLTHDFISPPNENIAQIIGEIMQGQLFSQVRQRELDQWRSDNPGVLGHVNLMDAQFRNWVIR